MKISVKAIPILVRERRVLLLREKQYDGGNNAGLWDCPGGTRRDGETLFETLNREMKEECGLNCPQAEVFDMYAYQTNDTIRLYIPVPFWHKPAVILGTDHDVAEWFMTLPPDEMMMPKLRLLCLKALESLK